MELLGRKERNPFSEEKVHRDVAALRRGRGNFHKAWKFGRFWVNVFSFSAARTGYGAKFCDVEVRFGLNFLGNDYFDCEKVEY